MSRSINASAYTGINGDADPDNDGWAIVARSTKTKNSGTPAHFWIDDQKIPHVSIRTENKGCVQFTPRSLKVVKEGKLRTLKQEAKNTSTCRAEPPEQDVDNNTISDNQQPLYRARNGQTANNEDSKALYLERNSTAAEAQLSLSDHSHANSWNLFATSKNDATTATFVKLVMVTNENGVQLPTILATKTTTNKKGITATTCIALQPTSTKVITKDKQDRKLKRVVIPEGTDCE